MSADALAASLAEHGFPPAEVLRELVRDLTEVDLRLSHVLDAPAVPAGPPQPLSACVVLPLDGGAVERLRRKWAISTRSRSGAEYTILNGKTDGVGPGVKNARSKQAWPRTGRGRWTRKSTIYLHRWIAAYVWGPAGAEACHATHICGNARCLLAAHIRWQLGKENVDLDTKFHRLHNRVQRANSARFARKGWPGG